MALREFEIFAEELAAASGGVVLPYFRTALAAENKALGGAFDPVTEADRAAEAIMRQMIEARFPDHGILGEEFGPDRTEAEYVWVLDPIDGTRSFVSGIPLWGTLIGLTRGGVPAFGLMHQPYIGERFSGNGGEAHFTGPYGRGRLRTRACPSLREGVLFSTSPYLFGPDEIAPYRRVEERAKLVRYGTDCYAYCMLASGQIDVVVEAGLQPYDIVALIPIVEGAGGIVTSWDGGSAAGGGRIVACGDKRLHAEVLGLLAG